MASPWSSAPLSLCSQQSLTTLPTTLDYSQTDLNEFFLTLQPRIPQGTHPKLEGIDGATGPTTVTNAGPESDLDFQISYPLIWPQNSILFQTDDDVSASTAYVDSLSSKLISLFYPGI